MVDGCEGVDYGSIGANNGSPDGIIAMFWADLTTGGADDGVWYQIVEPADARLVAWYQFIVEYQLPVWNGSPTPCHFEVVLSGDGSVLFQYQTMPEVSGVRLASAHARPLLDAYRITNPTVDTVFRKLVPRIDRY